MKLCLLVLASVLGMASARDITNANCSQTRVVKCMKINGRRTSTCKNGEKAKLRENCCMTCLPAFSCPTPPACQAGKQSTKDEKGCPSCRPKRICTKDKIKACKASFGSLPTCAPGIRPSVNETSCCMDCTMDISNIQCDEATENACKQALKSRSLPACEANTRPAFNATTCCKTCNPPTPPEDERPDKNGKCGRAKALKGIKNLEECEIGEKPVAVPDQCTFSCKRPESACQVREVAECMAQRPDCSNTTQPTRVEGECCKSCVKPRPTCKMQCGQDKVCYKGECRGKKKLALRLKSKTTAKIADKEEMRRMVVEMIYRYCSNPDNAEKCKAVDDTVESVDAEEVEGKEGEYTVGFGAVGDVQPTRRLLTTQDEKEDLVTDAINSESADAGLDVIASGSTENGASRLAFSTTAIFAATLLALF